MTIQPLLDALMSGERLGDAQMSAFAGIGDTGALMEAARAVRDRRSGGLVTYSPKVFIPLTELCRDVCRYCTFAKTPGGVRTPYLTVDEAIGIARRGAAAGCTEALFTLGISPSGGTGRRAKRWRRWASSPPSTTWSMPRGGCTRRPASCPTSTPA